MWHAYALLARDRMLERQREAAAVALARQGAPEGVGRNAVSSGRRALAAVLRRLAAVAGSLAAVAGSLAAAARGMAARLEGRTEARVQERVA